MLAADQDHEGVGQPLPTQSQGDTAQQLLMTSYCQDGTACPGMPAAVVKFGPAQTPVHGRACIQLTQLDNCKICCSSYFANIKVHDGAWPSLSSSAAGLPQCTLLMQCSVTQIHLHMLQQFAMNIDAMWGIVHSLSAE